MALTPLDFAPVKTLRRRWFCQPHIGNTRGGLGAITSAGDTFNDTAPKWGITFVCPASGPLNGVLLRVYSIVTPGTQSFTVQLQGVTADGVPDNNIIATSNTLTEASATTGAFIAEFASPPTLTAGVTYSLVFVRGGTADFTLMLMGGTIAGALFGAPSAPNVPSLASATSSNVWSKSTITTATIPFHWLRIDGVWRNCGFIYPMKGEFQEQLITAGTEYGIAIVPVHDMASTGLRLWVDINETGSPATDGYFRIYDSDGTTVLRTTPLDESLRTSVTGGICNVFWPTTRLSAGKQYYIGITGAGNWKLQKLATGDETGASHGNLRQGVFGHNVWLTSRATVGSGAWTAINPSATEIPLVGFYNAGNYQ